MARCTKKKNKELEAQSKGKSSLTLIAKQVKNERILKKIEFSLISFSHILEKRAKNLQFPLISLRNEFFFLGFYHNEKGGFRALQHDNSFTRNANKIASFASNNPEKPYVDFRHS